MNPQCYAIISCLEGSWMYDALHDITPDQQRKLVLEFIDQYGQEALDQAVTHIASDYSMDTIPDFMLKRIG